MTHARFNSCVGKTDPVGRRRVLNCRKMGLVPKGKVPRATVFKAKKEIAAVDVGEVKGYTAGIETSEETG